jgi:hypothetical protein
MTYSQWVTSSANEVTSGFFYPAEKKQHRIVFPPLTSPHPFHHTVSSGYIARVMPVRAMRKAVRPDLQSATPVFAGYWRKAATFSNKSSGY